MCELLNRVFGSSFVHLAHRWALHFNKGLLKFSNTAVWEIHCPGKGPPHSIEVLGTDMSLRMVGLPAQPQLHSGTSLQQFQMS